MCWYDTIEVHVYRLQMDNRYIVRCVHVHVSVYD